MSEQEAEVINESNPAKVSQEVLVQLNARKVALNSANVLFQMAQREFQLYQQEQIGKLGLDVKKVYRIDEKTGIVNEIKEEPVVNGTKA